MDAPLALPLDLLWPLLTIVAINLLLSGDNALVIGLAARNLPGRQRERAIVLGAIGAVAVRLALTAPTTLLLQLPLLQAAGGLVLLWIAFGLLRQREVTPATAVSSTLSQAVRVIVVADVVMSLDNVLAVGAAAHGNLPLLLVGLALSMPLILVGGGLIAEVLTRLPWLVYPGAALLVATAAGMVFDEPTVHQYLPLQGWSAWAVTALLIGVILGLAAWRNRRLAAGNPPARQDGPSGLTSAGQDHAPADGPQ